MALTELGQLLIDGLQLCSLEEWQRAVIFLKMDSPEKQLEMVRFIGAHNNATAEQLMAAAAQIAGE